MLRSRIFNRSIWKGLTAIKKRPYLTMERNEKVNQKLKEPVRSETEVEDVTNKPLHAQFNNRTFYNTIFDKLALHNKIKHAIDYENGYFVQDIDIIYPIFGSDNYKICVIKNNIIETCYAEYCDELHLNNKKYITDGKYSDADITDKGIQYVDFHTSIILFCTIGPVDWDLVLKVYKTQFIDTLFKCVNIDGVHFDNCYFENVTFHCCSIASSTFTNCTFTNTKIVGSMSNAQFNNCKFIDNESSYANTTYFDTYINNCFADAAKINVSFCNNIFNGKTYPNIHYWIN